MFFSAAVFYIILVNQASLLPPFVFIHSFIFLLLKKVEIVFKKIVVASDFILHDKHQMQDEGWAHCKDCQWCFCACISVCPSKNILKK